MPRRPLRLDAAAADSPRSLAMITRSSSAKASSRGATSNRGAATRPCGQGASYSGSISTTPLTRKRRPCSRPYFNFTPSPSRLHDAEFAAEDRGLRRVSVHGHPRRGFHAHGKFNTTELDLFLARTTLSPFTALLSQRPGGSRSLREKIRA